jgi:hypothetical protein
MIVWLLVVTLHFTFDNTSFELPLARQCDKNGECKVRPYDTIGECDYVGYDLAQRLEQDGVTVKYKCIEVEKEHL